SGYSAASPLVRGGPEGNGGHVGGGSGMSEPAPSSIAEGPGVDPAQAVNGEAAANEIDRVLADFRAWLTGATSADGGALPSTAPPTIDLHTLLGHFIGLRQEVNLQTRATRTQQEQNDRVLARLEDALEALVQAQS